MAVTVRPADYASDREEMVAVLQRNLPWLPHDRLFDWLYLRNPEGRALAWVATDGHRVAGVAGAFPRRVYCNGGEKMGYVLGDFCIEPQYRSLGLALALQRACLEGVSRAGDFAIDFPSQNMLAVYKRLRIETSHRMVRFARIIRADRKIQAKLPVPLLARAMSAVANVGIKVVEPGAGPTPGCAIAEESGPWGEEFTDAAQNWSSAMGTCVARTAEFLNWRYNNHPDRQYEMLTARRNRRLCGYVVFHGNGENGTVDDVLAGDDAVKKTLLHELATVARRRGMHTLSALSLADYPGTKILEQSGFRPRESAPVMLVTLPEQAPEHGTAPWYLSAGDPEG